MAMGLWLFGTAFMNRREGFEGLNAIPAGYKVSALGLIIFGATGVFDLGGHALFGFEVDNESALQPHAHRTFSRVGHAEHGAS